VGVSSASASLSAPALALVPAAAVDGMGALGVDVGGMGGMAGVSSISCLEAVKGVQDVQGCAGCAGCAGAGHRLTGRVCVCPHCQRYAYRLEAGRSRGEQRRREGTRLRGVHCWALGLRLALLELDEWDTGGAQKTEAVADQRAQSQPELAATAA